MKQNEFLLIIIWLTLYLNKIFRVLKMVLGALFVYICHSSHSLQNPETYMLSREIKKEGNEYWYLEHGTIISIII